MAFVANSQGDVKTAIKYHSEALGLQRKVLGDEDPDTALTLGRLGNLSIEIADYSSSRKYYENALAIRRKVLGNQHEKTAETLNNLGIVAKEQGDYPAAQKFYEEALAINRKALGKNDTNTAAMLNNMGNLALNRKDYLTARKLFDEALVIYRKVLGNQHEDTAQTLNNLGLTANNQGDKLGARKYYEEALAITRKVLGPQHPNYAAILNNLGVLADGQKDYLSARKQYESALAIKRNTLGNEHPDTADTLYNLATMSYSQKDFLASRKYFDESRRIMRTHVQRTLPGLSESEQVQFLDNVYLKRWTHSLSFGWFQRHDQAIINSAVSWLINGKAVAQESLAARALLARDATNPQLAQVIKELTAVRQQLSALALSSAKPGEAGSRQKTLDQLSAEEQRLARVLRQSTGETAADQGWVELEAIRQTLPPDAIYIDLVRMPLFDFDKQKTSPPHYLAWIIPGGKDARLSVFDLGEAAALERTIEQARAALAKAADENSQLRKDGEAAASAQAAKDLQVVANVVLKPLLPQLANKKQLILSPDGALWLLPWGALPVAENKSLLEQCSLRFVLSGRDLVKKETASKLSPGAPAIFVNPDYDLIGSAAKAAIQAILPQTTFDETETRSITSRSSLPRVTPLPFTSLEGAAAAPLFEQLTKSEPQKYEQDQALEAVVKNLQRPKHLLFSTHGFFLPDQERKEIDDKLLSSSNTRALPALTTDGQPIENPLLRCGLLFAGCNAPRTPGLDDGILTGLEIVGLDLRGTELVVLSACETGIGRVRNGEGVAGLRQAFQLAGAQSVVSTLWQVPDRDSAIIMQDFFTNLAAGQSKADALRNAQLKRIEARKEKTGAAHPFFWAAWTVTGN
jgi:CHAT domain-containing protein/Tfp pilus assembly protein PilF